MSTGVISEDFHTEGKIINYNNGKKESVEWNGKFDGNDGVVKIKTNNFNGDSFSKTIPFTKDTFQELFNQHISGASLENRLMTDFEIDNDLLSEQLIAFDENISKKNKNNKTKNQNQNRNKNKNKKRKSRKYKK